MYFFASNTFLDNRILIFNWNIPPLLFSLLLLEYQLESMINIGFLWVPPGKSQHSPQRLRVKTSKCCVEQKFISGTRNYIPSCIDSSAEEINDQEAIFKSNNGWISDNQKCNFLTTFCLVFWIWLKLYFGYEVLQFSRSIICVSNNV